MLAPSRVLMTRLMLYYVDRYGFTRPWISAKNALAELAQAGDVVPEDIDGTPLVPAPAPCGNSRGPKRSQKKSRTVITKG